MQGKVALVTGGTGGLGTAICIELAKGGAKVAFINGERCVARQRTEYLNVGIVFNSCAQFLFVPAAANLVQNDAGDVYLFIEILVATQKRGDTARYPLGIDDKDHGRM